MAPGMNSVSLLGVRIDNVDVAQTRALFRDWLGDKAAAMTHLVCTPNPEFLLAAQHDASFKELLNGLDLNLPDGVGLRFASAALTEQTLRNRVPGVQALLLLAELCVESQQRLLLLGEQGANERAAAELRLQWPGLDVVVLDPGVIAEAGDLPPNVIDEMRGLQAQVIAVGLGQGKQERCIFGLHSMYTLNVDHLSTVRVMIGVGGAAAMIGKTLPRAPRLLQRIGLEWVWRLAIEPRRWRRIWRATVVFPLMVILLTLREHRFWRAVRRTLPEIFLQLIGR